MAFDIPNLVTFPLEISIAFLILWLDLRQRAREKAQIERHNELEQKQKAAESKQMERFSNWVKESSKQQLFMLDSILTSLNHDQASIFRTEVGNRFSNEISNDLDDLENLLNQKEKISHVSDPKLEADIESKIDELESAKVVANAFLPDNFKERINNIANWTKESIEALQQIPINIEIDDKESDFPNLDLKKINTRPTIKLESKEILIDDMDKIRNEIKDLRNEIKTHLGDQIEQALTQTSDIGKKALSNIIDMGKSFKDIINKQIPKEEENKSKEKEKTKDKE